MAVQHISVFTDFREDEQGRLNKTFEIQIVNLTADGNEETAELQALDLEDLKLLKREFEKSIQFEKSSNDDFRITDAR